MDFFVNRSPTKCCLESHRSHGMVSVHKRHGGVSHFRPYKMNGFSITQASHFEKHMVP